MTTPIKDPFDDLLDMGSSDQPPLPTSDPPGGDSWMVLSKEEDDFQSITADDLFGSGSSSRKAHGSTFDDLFGEGSSSNKAKSTHGSTFDDLFNEPSQKLDSSHGTAFKDILGTDIDKQPTADSSGETSSKSSGKTEKVTVDDLFTDTPTKSETITPNWDEGIDELFGSGKPATKVEKTDEALDDLFALGTKKTKDDVTEKPAKSTEDALADIFGEPVVKREKSRSRDTPVKKTTESAEESLIDIFGPPQTEKSPAKKADPILDIFGNDSNVKDENKKDLFAMESENVSEDLFKSSPIIKSAESKYDDLFGGNSSTIETPEDHKTDGADTRGENDGAIPKMGKSDLDLFLDVEPTLTSNESKKDNDTAEEMFSDKHDGKAEAVVSPVEVVVSPVEESAKTSMGGNADDIDFTVIEDTSLLDLHLSRHKTSLRKRGSLARRKKPTRSSMRPAEDIFASSSNGGDIDGDKKNSDDDEEPVPFPGNKEDDKGDNQTPVLEKKSPVAGGMMLIGPGALAQSELMKGIMRKGRKDSGAKNENVASSNQSSLSKTATNNEPSVSASDKEEKAKPKVSGSPINKLFGAFKPDSKSSSSKDETKHLVTAMKPEAQEVKSRPTSVSKLDEDKSKSVSVSTPPKPVSVIAPPKPERVSTPSKPESVSTLPEPVSVSTPPKPESVGTPPKPERVGTPPRSDSDEKQGMGNKPVIKTNKPQIQARSPAVSASDSKVKETLFSETSLKPVTPLPRTSMSNTDNNKRSPFSTALKPISPNVPEKTSTEKKSSVILEKVTLRSTRSSAGDAKVTSPTTENKAIVPDLAERKNSLRRVKKAEESADTKEGTKSEPSWLKDMKRRSWSRGSDEGSVTVPELRSPAVKTSLGDPVKLSDTRPSKVNRSEESPRKSVSEKPNVLPDKPSVLPNKPKLAKKPAIDRPKPKVDVISSLNGRGESPSKSSNGVKETNVINDDTPSWKRELAERNKKKKPEGPSPPKTETPPEVTVNWRSQLSQKKRKPVVTGTGDGKTNSADMKQPEWAIQAEQRRARLAKSGILGQK